MKLTAVPEWARYLFDCHRLGCNRFASYVDERGSYLCAGHALATKPKARCR